MKKQSVFPFNTYEYPSTTLDRDHVVAWPEEKTGFVPMELWDQFEEMMAAGEVFNTPKQSWIIRNMDGCNLSQVFRVTMVEVMVLAS